MRKASLLSCFVCVSLFIQAQNDFQLVAQRGSRNRFYKTGAPVKVIYTTVDTIAEFKGRIAAVTADSIFMRRFNDNGYRLGIAVNQLESVRKVRRVARAITGFVAVVATIYGTALIVEDNKDHSDWLDGLEAATGFTLMMLGATTYIVTAATEPVSRGSKGYRFMVVRKQE